VVKILKSVYDRIKNHAERGYPDEVCGLLIGRDGKIDMFIDMFKEARNLNRERSRDRYELDPLSYIEADDEARAKGDRIIGIYHSHPDHPPLPSPFDREIASVDYVYIILSIRNGRFHEGRAWILRGEDKDSPFSEEILEVISDSEVSDAQG